MNTRLSVLFALSFYGIIDNPSVSPVLADQVRKKSLKIQQRKSMTFLVSDHERLSADKRYRRDAYICFDY